VSRQARDARRLPPRPHQEQPPGSGRLVEPVVEGRRRQPRLVDAVVAGGQQPRGVRHLHQQGQRRLVDVEGRRCPRPVPHAEAAGPQDPRRGQRPELEQVLDLADRRGRGSGGGAVDAGGVDRHVLVRRDVGLHLTVDPAAAQVQRHLPGQHHGAGVARDEQAVREQPLDRCRGGVPVDVAVGVVQAAGRRAPGQGVEGVPGRRRRLGQQPVEPGRVGEHVGQGRGRAHRVAGGLQPQVLGEPGEPARSVGVQGVGDRRAQARG
jgi:hypothetical protein